VLPWIVVDQSPTPDGTTLVLARRGTEWEVRADRATLMSSRMHASEEALAHLAFEHVPAARTVLVGGLGLGYTLRAVLDHLPKQGRVTVAELSPALVEWNRTHVADLAGRPLEDPRVTVAITDVATHIVRSGGTYDAILLDVDNGPASLVQDANARLYGDSGIHACRNALKPGGALLVWSLDRSVRYVERLQRAGFAGARAIAVRAREGGNKRHIVFLAKRDGEGRSTRPAFTSAREKEKGRAPGGARPVRKTRA
jgi:spermidine synthase